MDLYSHRNDLIIRGRNARLDVLANRSWDKIIKSYDEMFEMTKGVY